MTADMELPTGPGVTLMLCDHAAVADGKLYISGGGWNVTGPAPSPFGIAVLVSVPWAMANRRITLSLTLVGEDGESVAQAGPDGAEPIRIDTDLEVGRPPGLRPGTPLDVPLALNLPPLPLPAGGRFTWELTLDGESRADWRLSFSTRAAPRAAET